MPKVVVVTGGSGKTGRACIRDLLAHGYEVFSVDRVAPGDGSSRFVLADLTDFGQVVGALSMAGSGPGEVAGVLHLAAMLGRVHTDQVTFSNNVTSTYNVFEAASGAGIKNVVYASSDSLLGVPFDEPPVHLPLDEESPPRPWSAYSLSKLLAEEMARQFCRWDASMKMVGLRFSNIMEPKDYARFPSFQEDARRRKWNLWGYVDSRDAAQSVRKALEAPIAGAEVFGIAAAETVMARTDAELLAEVFPRVPVRRELGPNETLHSIEKARRVLGYQPEHSWRNRSDHAQSA